MMRKLLFYLTYRVIFMFNTEADTNNWLQREWKDIRIPCFLQFRIHSSLWKAEFAEIKAKE
jgi:hypothetical protein